MVAKFARSQYSPGLFDVAQDIVGGLPIRLVARWLESEQSREDAARLLAPTRVIGYLGDGLRALALARGFAEIHDGVSGVELEVFVA